MFSKKDALKPKVTMTTFNSPIGLIYLATLDGQLCSLTTGPKAEKQLQEHLHHIDPTATLIESSAPFKTITDQLQQYFAGERLEFDLPLRLRGTDFQLSVWRELLTIPYGRTVTYGELAQRLGDVKSVRAVGAANGKNPISIIVPCHRVIAGSGALTGYAGGLEIKRYLLDHEAQSNNPTLF